MNDQVKGIVLFTAFFMAVAGLAFFVTKACIWFFAKLGFGAVGSSLLGLVASNAFGFWLARRIGLYVEKSERGVAAAAFAEALKNTHVK